MKDINLTTLAREVAADSGLHDPREIAEKMLAGMSGDEMTAALRATLPGYVRDVIGSQQRQAMRRAFRPNRSARCRASATGGPRCSRRRCSWTVCGSRSATAPVRMLVGWLSSVVLRLLAIWLRPLSMTRLSILWLSMALRRCPAFPGTLCPPR